MPALPEGFVEGEGGREVGDAARRMVNAALGRSSPSNGGLAKSGDFFCYVR